MALHHALLPCHLQVVDGDHRVGLYAARDVPPAQELTFDYGPEFWSLVGGGEGSGRGRGGGGGGGKGKKAQQ
jgi:hypothetical protein